MSEARLIEQSGEWTLVRIDHEDGEITYSVSHNNGKEFFDCADFEGPNAKKFALQFFKIASFSK